VARAPEKNHRREEKHHQRAGAGSDDRSLLPESDSIEGDNGKGGIIGGTGAGGGPVPGHRRDGRVRHVEDANFNLKRPGTQEKNWACHVPNQARPHAVAEFESSGTGSGGGAVTAGIPRILGPLGRIIRKDL
jgi:hypothetical protein